MICHNNFSPITQKSHLEGCEEGRKRIIRKKQAKFVLRIGEMFFKKSRKGNFLYKYLSLLMKLVTYKQFQLGVQESYILWEIQVQPLWLAILSHGSWIYYYRQELQLAGEMSNKQWSYIILNFNTAIQQKKYGNC